MNRLLSNLIMSIDLVKLKPSLSHQYGIKESSAPLLRLSSPSRPRLFSSLTLPTFSVLFRAMRSSKAHHEVVKALTNYFYMVYGTPNKI
jgi:hypothetical protein